MSIQERVVTAVPVIPENAPFTHEQRAWLNGFFAGVLSLDAPAGVTSLTGALPAQASLALSADGDDGQDPWHDASMAIDERMKLADGRPQRRKLYAAMAQQDCGQCGYLCESYADVLARGEEKRANLCVPGGKETSRMLKQLLEAGPAVAADASPVVVATELIPVGKTAAQRGYSREAPVEAVFKSAKRISGKASEKDTRHIAFDISESGIDYEPGDSFGIIPVNEPTLADAILAAMRAPPDFPVQGPNGTMPFRQALIEDYALGAAPDMLFELISYMVGGERRQRAKLLAKGGDPDGDAATLDVLAALEKFGPLHPDPEAFLECLEPLQPRLYSISSSPRATPGELHLTVDTVRYQIGQRQRLGVGSTFLADRMKAGSKLKVYLQKAHGFGLPLDPATPIIMVGPGTGIAPFRSFLWHRAAIKAPGDAWLFYGHQREQSEFFYRDELEGFLKTGTLTRLSTAWSRDGAHKVYVQDRMREAGADLWSWLKRGAHFYVCGDAKRMAKDVEAAIVAVAHEHGLMSEAGARDFLAEMKAAKRFAADVY